MAIVVDGTDPASVDAGPVAVVSFSEFYQSHYESAVRLAFALVGRRDIAEELVQDSFVSLHRRWRRVSQYESPAGLLRRVVLNRSLSELRRRSTQLRLLGRLSRERAPHVELHSSDAAVWRAVGDLSKRQAQVIALMFVDDLTVSEIADVLECDDTTVRTHLRRARQTLSKRLRLEEDQ